MPGLFFGNGPFQFLQTGKQLTILSEYQHFTRTINLDGRPHLSKNIKMFLGDSVGHWEGNTLIVDTTNFNGVTAYSREIPYLTDALHTVERFTLVDAKSNLTPLSAEAPWYELASEVLPNAEPPIYPKGDGVQAVRRAYLSRTKAASSLGPSDPNSKRLDLN